MEKILKETRPVKYQDLIMQGSINDILEMSSQEIANQEEIIEKQLKEKHQRPDTQNYTEIAQYENMIRNLKMELIDNMIVEKVKEM